LAGGTPASHAANAAAAEEATTLMKEMSIDQIGMSEAAAAVAMGSVDAENVAAATVDAGLLMRNMSIDERTVPTADADYEDQGNAATTTTTITPKTGVAPLREAFGSDQKGVAPTTVGTNTTIHEHETAGRDPSLSSLLDVAQQRVPSNASPGAGAAGGATTAEGSEDVLLAAFAVHRSRAAAKAAGIKK
jgi:hypothetical protein